MQAQRGNGGAALLFPRGTFTRVPQDDQHGWINQSEPCKQFLSTEVINRVDRWTSWRWSTSVQRRWFTLGDSPQITRINKRWLTTDYPYQQAVTHHRLPVSTGGDSPQITRFNKQVTNCSQCRTSRTSFFPLISFFLKCVDILSPNSHISQQHLPAQVHLPPFWNRLPRSTFVELCKQYRSTVEFNFVDSTAVTNLGDPCKRPFALPLILTVRTHRTYEVSILHEL